MASRTEQAADRAKRTVDSTIASVANSQPNISDSFRQVTRQTGVETVDVQHTTTASTGRERVNPFGGGPADRRR